MFFTFKKITFTVLFNSSLFLLLIIGIQNNTNKNRVNLLMDKTVELPVGFIIGSSFISGSLLGSLFSIQLGSKR